MALKTGVEQVSLFLYHEKAGTPTLHARASLDGEREPAIELYVVLHGVKHTIFNGPLAMLAEAFPSTAPSSLGSS